MKLKTGVILQKVTINASPIEVYKAFIDARIHSAFTGSKATCVPKVNGKTTAWDGYITGKNVKLVKGKRIVQEWRTTGWPEGYPPSILDLSFKKRGNKTLLTMKHSKVPKSGIKSYASGWKAYYWKPLSKYFSNR